MILRIKKKSFLCAYKYNLATGIGIHWHARSIRVLGTRWNAEEVNFTTTFLAFRRNMMILSMKTSSEIWMSFNFRLSSLPAPWSSRFLFLINFMSYLIPWVYFFLSQRCSFMALPRGEKGPMSLNAKEKCWTPMRGCDVHVASKLQRVPVEWMDALKLHEIYRCISVLEVSRASRVADALPRFPDLSEAHFQGRSLAPPTFSWEWKIYEKGNKMRRDIRYWKDSYGQLQRLIVSVFHPCHLKYALRFRFVVPIMHIMRNRLVVALQQILY